MKKHTLAGVLAIAAGFAFRLPLYEWLWLLLSVFLVIVMETWNTVIENLVDLTTDYHFHPLAKIAKDMAAGAVLMTSIFAGIVGLILFVPRIFEMIQNLL